MQDPDDSVLNGGAAAGMDNAPQSACRVHLLDVGEETYGDCILCQFGSVSVLIDGAHPQDWQKRGEHPSIPEQLAQLLGQNQPLHVSLLIVTHAHSDHIGCLPALVKKGILTADWALVTDPGMGWGRNSANPPDADAPENVRALQAGLREESRAGVKSDAALTQFLSDAVSLESSYNDMLDTLRTKNTQVVRYGHDNPSVLLAQFAPVGLTILGPSLNQLLACAKRIASGAGRGAPGGSDAFADALRHTEDNLVAAYRRLIEGQEDADADSRPGSSVNDQSLIVSFAVNSRKMLFTGDMQFITPQLPTINAQVQALRALIRANGPYDFIKMAHHGSSNGFDATFLRDAPQTKYYGICTGQNSPDHPAPETLALLKNNADHLIWARTDRNRLTTFDLSGNAVNVQMTQGHLNDSTPNSADTISEAASPTAPPSQGTATPSQGVVTPPQGTAPTGGALAATSSTSGINAASETSASPALATPAVSMQETTRRADDRFVEISVRVPHVKTRVTLTIDVQPQQADGDGPQDRPPEANRDGGPNLNIAGGRNPPVLFVTSRDALSERIGRPQTDHLLQSLRTQGFAVYDALPAGLADANQAAPLIAAQVKQYWPLQVQGVVAIGGYDVVPSQRLNVLDAALQNQVDLQDDPYDNFVVWSDAYLGDPDGDGFPDLPVSRIPDAGSADFVFTAIQAVRSTSGLPPSGIRNIKRPFADDVFRNVSAQSSLLTSATRYADETPPYSLNAGLVYLMLHGDHEDAAHFWGEQIQEAAIGLNNVPRHPGSIVFTGCCWGALPVDVIARRYSMGQPLPARTPDNSLALRFLRNGALAFIGCTGSHYSPLEPQYNYFGKPLHDAFWKRCTTGMAPMQALFEAKKEYLGGIPHRNNAALERAIEMKILRQYTCLGLGW